jgi:hypothetical protein
MDRQELPGKYYIQEKFAIDSHDNYKITKCNGITEIIAPHSTRVIINNPNYEFTYFDTSCLPNILASSSITTDDNNYFTIYGKSNDEEFKLTLNATFGILEIRNEKLDLGYVTDIDITNAFSKKHIIKTHHPAYQYTQNPAIILTVLFMLAYYIDDKKLSYQDLTCPLLTRAEKICETIEDDDNYYLDEMTILILSIYTQRFWILQKQVLNIVDNKIFGIHDKISGLQMEQMGNNQFICNGTNGNSQFISIKSKIRECQKQIDTYNDLNRVFKTFKDTDEILELKIGSMSYFLLKRNDTIMTFTSDEYVSTDCKPIDNDIISTYLLVMSKSNDIFACYNEWVNNVIEYEKEQMDYVS